MYSKSRLLCPSEGGGLHGREKKAIVYLISRGSAMLRVLTWYASTLHVPALT